MIWFWYFFQNSAALSRRTSSSTSRKISLIAHSSGRKGGPSSRVRLALAWRRRESERRPPLRRPAPTRSSRRAGRRKSVTGLLWTCHCRQERLDGSLASRPGGLKPRRKREPCAPVAQLDRAPDYEFGGQEFESLRARQHLTRIDWASLQRVYNPVYSVSIKLCSAPDMTIVATPAPQPTTSSQVSRAAPLARACLREAPRKPCASKAPHRPR